MASLGAVAGDQLGDDEADDSHPGPHEPADAVGDGMPDDVHDQPEGHRAGCCGAGYDELARPGQVAGAPPPQPGDDYRGNDRAGRPQPGLEDVDGLESAHDAARGLHVGGAAGSVDGSGGVGGFDGGIGGVSGLEGAGGAGGGRGVLGGRVHGGTSQVLGAGAQRMGRGLSSATATAPHSLGHDVLLRGTGR